MRSKLAIALAAIEEWGWSGLLSRLNLSYFNHRRRLRRLETSEDFDGRYGVETRQKIRTPLFTSAYLKQSDAVMYWPTPASYFREMIGSIDCPLENFDFVDIGCGKGRILILADEMGFRSVSGIEAEASLYDICLKNLRAIGLGHINVHLNDAADVIFDGSDKIFYLFRPFGISTLSKFLRSI